MQQKPSTSKRKAIITVVLFFAVLLVLYSSVHAGLNLHAQHTYASADNGFSKNALGDYSKQADDMNLTFYKAPYLSFRTNLSAGNEDIALIIWISLIGDKKEYRMTSRKERDRSRSTTPSPPTTKTSKSSLQSTLRTSASSVS